jgi:hypothetical protein
MKKAQFTGHYKEGHGFHPAEVKKLRVGPPSTGPFLD